MDLFKEEKKERDAGLYGRGAGETHDVAFKQVLTNGPNGS
jgi:hypothetical protein